MNWKHLFRRVSRDGLYGILTLGLLAAGVLMAGCASEPPAEAPSAIALWIDNEPVQVNTFKHEVETTLRTCYVDLDFSDSEYAMIIDQTIKDMVRDKVIRERAAELGITVNPDDVRLETPERSDFPEGFESLDRVEQEWRHRIQNRMESMILAAEIARSMSTDIGIDDSHLEAMYQENIDRFTKPESLDLRVIRVYDPDLADDLHNKLKRGWKFTRLAEIYSNMRGDGAGGRVFSKERGEFSVPFESELMDLKPGQITDVLTSQEGYFIYRLEKKHPAAVLPFEEVKDRLQDEYRSREEARIFQEWLDREARKVVVRMGTPLPYPGEHQ